MHGFSMIWTELVHSSPCPRARCKPIVIKDDYTTGIHAWVEKGKAVTRGLVKLYVDVDEAKTTIRDFGKPFQTAT